ncbi:MAG: RluA family pseudouridine synthase [Proteobacteria bacterium]|nr:RluA family pseudouridine synthase [Pseudomonadota bacterium]
MTSPQLQPFIISLQEEGERLDKVFQRKFPLLSFGRIQKAVRSGEVKVNGKKTEASYRVKKGDLLRVPPPFYASSEKRPFSSEIPPASFIEIKEFEKNILYENEDFIVWNKPFGFAVQGGTKVHKHLDNLLDRLVTAGRFTKENRPSLVHRLDKDTTGVLLLAKTRKMASFLAQGFAQKKISKLYWALCVGVPTSSEGKIKIPLLKKEISGTEKVVGDDKGKNAETLYRILDKVGDKVSWIALRPLTGRTHQLRVHCAHLGTPILGDGKYGSSQALQEENMASQKMCLHAFEMKLPLPTGEVKIFKAPLPPHMKVFFKEFGFETSQEFIKKSEGLFQ